jgi:Zn-dependent membrane protease YugP
LAVIAGSHLYTVYTYRRFSDHLTVGGLTGAQVARLLLDKVGLSQVKVKRSTRVVSRWI